MQHLKSFRAACFAMAAIFVIAASASATTPSHGGDRVDPCSEGDGIQKDLKSVRSSGSAIILNYSLATNYTACAETYKAGDHRKCSALLKGANANYEVGRIARSGDLDALELLSFAIAAWAGYSKAFVECKLTKDLDKAHEALSSQGLAHKSMSAAITAAAGQ